MKRMRRTLFLLGGMALGGPLLGRASGIPVVDVANLAQNIRIVAQSVAQTAKQIEQYKTQLAQYELELRNATAPKAFIWDRAQTTLGNLQRAMDTLAQYEKELGSLENVIASFHDYDRYRNTACVQTGRCSPEEAAQLEQTRRVGLELEKRAGEDLLRGIDQQQQALLSDANQLERLQSQAQGAQGQLEALSASNELASAQIHELLQMRAMLLAQQNLLAIQAQVQADRDARAAAASAEFRRGLDQDYEPQPGKGWKP
jgi:P-type conjugative transfer protein TrbJ